MKKLLITTAALSFALAGCQITYTEPPKFEHNKNDVYVWDDSKSTAKNWADIAVVPNGVKDAERAGDAQELISEAEQNAWTLVSLASGGLAQGLGMSSVFGVIDEAQNWKPTFVIPLEPQNLNSNDVLEIVRQSLKPVLDASEKFEYLGLSYRTNSHHIANAGFFVSGEGCPVTVAYEKIKGNYLNAPVGKTGCLMDIDIKVMPRAQLSDGQIKDIVSFELVGLRNNAIHFASLYKNPVIFPVGFPVNIDGKNIDMPFPFVWYNSKMHLFTESNAMLDMTLN